MAIRERKARTGTIPDGGMADIAFLLLIFFLVTTTIDMDKGIGIILPAEGQELEINKKNILLINFYLREISSSFWNLIIIENIFIWIFGYLLVVILALAYKSYVDLSFHYYHTKTNPYMCFYSTV